MLKICLGSNSSSARIEYCPCDSDQLLGLSELWPKYWQLVPLLVYITQHNISNGVCHFPILRYLEMDTVFNDCTAVGEWSCIDS